MEITTGAVSTLLPKLSGLVNDEYKLQKSVRGEIMFLEAELEAMQAALRLMISSASIDQPPNMQDKLWARDVRELSYDLEDNIDKFLVRIDHAPEHLHGLRAFIDRSLNLLTKAGIRHNIGTDIKVIKTRIRELSERHDRYKIDIVTAKPTRPSVDRLRLIALHKKATELIGTEEKANDLVKMLMEEEGSNQQLKIISIVGIGGLGKTTLANVVYQKLERQFDCGAFVTVSHDPKMDQIFKSMLYQINRDMYRNINGETWDETLLINELRNLLTNRRYFIVIDDIWNKSVLGNIMCALNRTGRGSRIIITTRILDVAEQTGSVYILEPLSSEDSRKLFYLRIFGTEERCLPKELAKESENILRKCGGVPLAIITIGGVLASKKENENTCKYWSKVYKSMGSGLENNSDDVTNMRSILSVSYYDLPLHLRTCFLYLTLYPEDYNISTPDLIWKWIGEGFVPQKPGMGMYEVGEDYIRELINRSLIQPSHIDIHNKLSICRIHDMVLDLITFLSNEEHFLSKLGVQQAQSIRSKLRRLTLQTKNQEFINKELEKTTVSHVRSLIVFSGALNLLPALSRFPVLRVLDLKQAQVGNDHFKDICNLFHLRYLALRRNCITEIPKEIGNLKFLQVLDINGTEIVKLPSSFVQLRQLVYLNFKSLVTIPDWFGYLKSLQELIGYIHLTSPAMLRIFSELTELRHVGLYFNKWDESYEKPFLSWLSSSVSLKYLTINGEVNIELGSRCDKLSPGPQQLQEINIYSAICSVPRWMSSLLSLAVLDISLMTLEEEDLQILGTLPSLYQLAISLKEPTLGRDKKLVVINAHLFLCLKRFELYKSTGVVFAQGAMENLQWLELSFGVRETIDHLGHFILGLGNLSSLKHVMVGLDYQKAKPEDVETAKAAIQTEIEMNPNNPRLCIGPMVVLKVNIQSKEIENKIIKIISTVEGVYGISTDPKEGKVTVLGFVSAHSVEKKLREAVGTAEIVELHWPRMS